MRPVHSSGSRISQQNAIAMGQPKTLAASPQVATASFETLLTPLSMQAAQALKASSGVRFGAALGGALLVTEASILKDLDTLGVPEFKDILAKAKEKAKALGHPEVTPIHILAVQFDEINDQAKQNQTNVNIENVHHFLEGERSVWNANLGPLVMMNSPGELSFHVQRMVAKINEALAQLPKAPVGSTPNPKLSTGTLAILGEKIAYEKQNQPTDDQLRREAALMADSAMKKMSPEGAAMKRKLDAELKSAEAILEAAAPAEKQTLEKFTQLFKEVPELAPLLHEYLTVFNCLSALKEGRIPDGIAVPLPTQPGEKPKMIPAKMLPKDELKALMPKFIAQLTGDFKSLETEFDQAYPEFASDITAIFGQIDPKNLKTMLPAKVLENFLKKQEVEKTLAKISGMMENSQDGSVVDKIKTSIKKARFNEVLTAVYDPTLDPRQLQDPATSTAYQLYQNFYNLLSGDSAVHIASLDNFLNSAVKLGAGDKEVLALTRLIGLVKRLDSDFKAGGEGEKGGEEDSAGRMFRIKLLRKASQFIRAFANINWNEVRAKKVDLDRAKTILDQDDLIPTPIKVELMNFLKTGNRNQWQGQPMLLLAGGGGTDMVKQAVVKALGEILQMPTYKPTGDISSTIKLGNGGRMIKGEPTLSPVAQAIVEKKTPNSIIYIDNLLRFSMNGGEDLFDQFASKHGRQNFKEPDFEVPLDLSPFVFVVGLDENVNSGYLSALHGDRFNDSDITIVKLGEDIDTFTKEKVAKRTAKQLEMRFNVRFGPGVVDAICREYAIMGRHDEVEHRLREVAKAAAGSVADGDSPIDIKLDDLETKWVGPKTTRFTNNVMTLPTVGSINGLAAGYAGYGCVLRIGVTKQAEWLFDPRKDTGGRYSVRAALGPVTKMTEDSAKKAFEAFLTDYLSNTVIGSSGQPYKLLQGLRHKAMSFQVVFPENVDGPSAGAAMAATAVSTVTGLAIRPDVAITGTIQDKGTVGAIGGIFGKTKASFEAGLRTVVMPEVNYIELKKEHPKFCAEMEKQGMKLVPVRTMDEVLKNVLVDYPALFKEPTPEQLKIDSYDPTGELQGDKDAGDKRLRALVEEVVKASQQTTTDTLNAALLKLAEVLKK